MSGFIPMVSTTPPPIDNVPPEDDDDFTDFMDATSEDFSHESYQDYAIPQISPQFSPYKQQLPTIEKNKENTDYINFSTSNEEEEFEDFAGFEEVVPKQSVMEVEDVKYQNICTAIEQTIAITEPISVREDEAYILEESNDISKNSSNTNNLKYSSIQEVSETINNGKCIKESCGAIPVSIGDHDKQPTDNEQTNTVNYPHEVMPEETCNNPHEIKCNKEQTDHGNNDNKIQEFFTNGKDDPNLYSLLQDIKPDTHSNHDNVDSIASVTEDFNAEKEEKMTQFEENQNEIDDSHKNTNDYSDSQFTDLNLEIGPVKVSLSDANNDEYSFTEFESNPEFSPPEIIEAEFISEDNSDKLNDNENDLTEFKLGTDNKFSETKTQPKNYVQNNDFSELDSKDDFAEFKSTDDFAEFTSKNDLSDFKSTDEFRPGNDFVEVTSTTTINDFGEFGSGNDFAEFNAENVPAANKFENTNSEKTVEHMTANNSDDFGNFSDDEDLKFSDDDDDNFGDFSNKFSEEESLSHSVRSLDDKIERYSKSYNNSYMVTDDNAGHLRLLDNWLHDNYSEEDSLKKYGEIENKGAITWSGELWENLEDIDNTNALSFIWNGSQHNKNLIKSLGLNLNNLMFAGNNKAYYVPSYYAIGLDTKDYNKGILKPMSAAEKITAISPKDKTFPSIALPTDSELTKKWDSTEESNNDDISAPVLDGLAFDVGYLESPDTCDNPASSNSTDLIDPSLLEFTTAPSIEVPPVKDSGSAKLTKLLASIKQSSSTTSTLSLQQGSVFTPEEESTLPQEAKDIIMKLPDLSYMRSKVLMFPVNLMSRVKMSDS